jgi:hypothetical protein
MSRATRVGVLVFAAAAAGLGSGRPSTGIAYSDPHWVALDPAFRAAAERAIGRASAAGLNLTITSAYRSQEEQDELGKRWQHNDKKGIVTKPATFSMHTLRCACDISISDMGRYGEWLGYLESEGLYVPLVDKPATGAFDPVHVEPMPGTLLRKTLLAAAAARELRSRRLSYPAILARFVYGPIPEELGQSTAEIAEHVASVRSMLRRGGGNAELPASFHSESPIGQSPGTGGPAGSAQQNGNTADPSKVVGQYSLPKLRPLELPPPEVGSTILK